jgi:hypothetical protein
MSFFKEPGANDYALRSNRLCIPFGITSHATPASKTHTTDLPSVLVLSSKNKTSTALGIDSGVGFTTEADTTGIFGILLYNLGTVSKLLDVSVVNLNSGTATVSRKGASSTGVTASGNIAVSVDSSLDFESASITGTVCVDFIVSEA